jgi:hypothetical protein
MERSSSSGTSTRTPLCRYTSVLRHIILRPTKIRIEGVEIHRVRPWASPEPGALRAAWWKTAPSMWMSRRLGTPTLRCTASPGNEIIIPVVRCTASTGAGWDTIYICAEGMKGGFFAVIALEHAFRSTIPLCNALTPLFRSARDASERPRWKTGGSRQDRATTSEEL